SWKHQLVVSYIVRIARYANDVQRFFNFYQNLLRSYTKHSRKKIAFTTFYDTDNLRSPIKKGRTNN
ncbi:MAG: hypothetical protein P8Y97_20075, partial [Candidatus Lokiarchaeota archaeon]